MGFLKRVFGGGEPVPGWASFFSPAEYREFLDAVAADLRRRGLRFEMGDGVVRVDAGGEGPSEFGLSNLSQLCHATERVGWPALIAGHFTSLISMQGRDLDALAADYEQVAPILRVRLMPDVSMGGVELPEAVSRPVAPGILSVLVYDFPDSTASVHRDHIASWPLDADGVFAQALDNLSREPAPIRETVDLGGPVGAAQGDSFYVATRALRLADELPPGTRDAIFAVPNRHTLLTHAIADKGVVAVMAPLFRMTVELHREGPGSISDQLYWWREGAIVQIPHELRGRDISVYPPDEFVALLESLPAGPAPS